jgi:hypothetical protein
MQKTTGFTTRLIAAFALAVALALAGQATASAYEGYGTGNCSLWQKIKSAAFGVDCHFL